MYLGNQVSFYDPTQTVTTVGKDGFYDNNKSISVDHTVPLGVNSMTAGPITVDPGVTVTVSLGSTWTVV
jgi:hypothetical protein